MKYLVNPGSVGQPRDGDPRAAYAIVDTDAQHVDLIRLTYPVETTQAKIMKAGLPEVLARRLGWRWTARAASVTESCCHLLASSSSAAA